MIRKGTYILIFDLPEKDIQVGALGILHFNEGTYCYAGSAMNGLDQRIKRHLSKDKKTRWHIDSLTTECIRIEAYESLNGDVAECQLCDIIRENGGIGSIKGFGCSDCRCKTHLFILDEASKKDISSDPRLSRYIG